MHYVQQDKYNSALCALHGIATVSCPSICLSVRDTDTPWPYKLG